MNISAMEEYKALAEKFAAMKKEVNAKSASLFKDVMTETFAQYPQVETISWRQYTPGFNDGDPCVFNRHLDAFSLRLNGVDKYGMDEDEEEVEGENLPESTFIEIASILDSFHDEVMDEMFTTDNYIITIKRDGTVEKEYYEPGY